MTRRKELGAAPPAVDNLSSIIRFLKKFGPHTYSEIAEGTGLTPKQVRSCVAKQRDKNPGEFFHVVEWRKAGFADMGVYAYGPGEDLDRPSRKLPPAPPRTHEPQRAFVIPEGPNRTRFVNNINPWTGERVEA